MTWQPEEVLDLFIVVLCAASLCAISAISFLLGLDPMNSVNRIMDMACMHIGIASLFFFFSSFGCSVEVSLLFQFNINPAMF